MERASTIFDAIPGRSGVPGGRTLMGGHGVCARAQTYAQRVRRPSESTQRCQSFFNAGVSTPYRLPLETPALKNDGQRTITDIELQMNETMSVESWVQCCHERLPNNDGAQVGSATCD